MTEAPRSRIRVLVVDDSAFARRVMREVLSADERIEVVGHARDGLEALEKIEALSPDVITLDLVMPELDGVGVLDALRGREDAPRAIVCSMSPADGPLAVAALAAGAFDLVTKPTALATDLLYDVRKELLAKVLLAGETRPAAPRSAAAAPLPAAPERRVTPVRTRLVVVGASTGGPRAISLLLAALPADFPVPLAIVVHMPVGYTEAFAARLDKESALEVCEASEMRVLRPGQAVIAQAGVHLHVDRRGDELVTTMHMNPQDSLHRPSVDELFTSAARSFGDGAVGVVLTGMGADGLEGARALHAAGATVLTEAAASCVVYGMPRAVADAGLSTAAVPIEHMAGALLSRLV